MSSALEVGKVSWEYTQNVERTYVIYHCLHLEKRIATKGKQYDQVPGKGGYL